MPADTVKHTPGPWQVRAGLDGNPKLDSRDGYTVDRADPTAGKPFVISTWSLPNARLIAAAPDMRTFIEHDQWQVIGRAIERYTAGEISDLHALGLITAGFLKLDADRQSVVAKAEGRP